MKIDQISNSRISSAQMPQFKNCGKTLPLPTIPIEVPYNKTDPSILNSSEGKVIETPKSPDDFYLEKYSSWTYYFRDSTMSSSPLISKAYSNFTHQADCAIGSFLDGNISKEELSSRFESMIGNFSTACEDAGYPYQLHGVQEVLQRTKALYQEIRGRILQIAVNRNNAEGQQYVSGGKNFNGDWKYYNSDYYYKTEEAFSALFDGVSNYTKDRPGFKNFNLQEIKADIKQSHYNNFNSAWNNQFVLSQQYLTDEEQVPPKGFKWFYQKGGSNGKQHPVIGKIYLDGREVEQTVYRAPFDPTKDTSATTWASFRDVNGKEHRVSTDFLFDVEGVDKYLVSALLQFTGGKSVQVFNQFLENFKVHSGNYFRSYDDHFNLKV